ncbi:hypothetical protein [Kangiella geojedonensis]|uniref:Uncharacterized protein n=1 Tax=Kangiella geojedonensis TaxID=914150 RepID=A0A0F6TRM0_9GAMM|nr:hypothetical protein [Kangiella geojedonensis]AKE52707.1 hypothetical protein TQ33_1766 [Kangiella geojedonensis]
MNKTGAYILLILLAVVSYWIALVTDDDSWFKGFLAVPGVIASLSIVAKILIDSVAYERQKYLQSNQHMFELASQSPMAEVIFEKHAEFCQTYIAKLHQVIGELFARGACEEATNMGRELASIRIDYSPWISEEMSENLIPIEHALIDIGSSESLAEALRGDASRGHVRDQAMQNASKLTSEILEQREGEGELDAKSIKKKFVLEMARDIIDVNSFFKIRKFAISSALDFIDSSEAK